MIAQYGAGENVGARELVQEAEWVLNLVVVVGLQARCKECLRTNTAELAELQALEKEGADLPAVQAEMSSLRRCV